MDEPEPRSRGTAAAPVSTDAPDSLGVAPVVVLTVIGLVLRLIHLRQPIRYDEAVTYLYFVAQPWATAVGSYLYPNNHVFHTVLAKVSTAVFGSDPWALRIPAFLAGTAMIPMTFVVGRRLVGVRAALIGAALVAASGPLVLYSTNARGYTIACLATLILLHLATRLRDRPSVLDWTMVVVVATLGLWTIPVVLFPAGGIAFWFLLSAIAGDTSEPRRDVRRLLLAAGATAIATLICYSPVLSGSGADPLIGNRFVAPSPWSVFFSEIAASVGEVFQSWRTGIPALVAIFVGLCAAVGLVVNGQRRMTRDVEDDRPARRISVAAIVYAWCAILLMINHRAPFARVWLFALPLVALLAGVGGLALLARLRRVPADARAAAEIAMGIAVAFSVSIFASRGVLKSRDTGTLPDAASIAQTLQQVLRPGDRVVAPVPSNAPLQFHLDRLGLDPDVLVRPPAADGTVYLLVNTAEGFTLESPVSDPVLKPFTVADLAQVYPFAQLYRLARSDSGG